MSLIINSWDAFKYHWRVWDLSGFRGPRRQSIWYIPHKLYMIVITLLFPIYYPTCFTVESLLADNLNDFCEVIYIAMADVTLNIKFLTLFIVRQQLLELRPILKRLDARAKTEEEIGVLQDGIDSAKKCFLIILRLFYSAFVTSQLMVIFSGEARLMYPAWYPFNYKATRTKFWIAYGYQTIGFLVQCTQACSVDTYPQAYMRVLTAHIRALSLRIEAIGRKSFNCDSSEFIPLTKDEMKRNYDELVSCIKDHKTIIELFSTIQKPISGTAMAQFVCTGVAQCTIGVYMLYVGFNISIMLNMAVFFVSVTMETLILCYYGDMFCQECEQLSKAIYNCNWTVQSSEFKKALCFFLLRSQRVNVLMAGNWIPVRLPTFVMVVKSSYSIFTLLSSFK
ncbi:odorant receptor 2a-like isoform X1 [Zeugodacus cucurbitae]|uniref:Odorant receptor n=3 Tax=Zeugodacus cucurbitae TaxID=28588 RepID=A0A6M9TYG5_ZEUCU|nr:odorant receptor 2a-like isoform X1 [Zeugodacus cucurbitae]XP_054086676.1 odorant receptor 2a-like isoform X1 [Zeugodacus cucurbitae]QKN21133.1 odorant receptor [Zeugodacus cucurbitae]